jgi:hypothetical protein
MPRRREVPKREILPDPKFGNVDLSKFVNTLMEDRYRLLFRLGLHLVERAIDNRFGDRLLAVIHDGVHEFRDHQIAELRVRIDLALIRFVTSGHVLVSQSRGPAHKTKAPKPEKPYFGRLAPYFERRCLRFFTPWVSSTPRMIW